MSPLRFDERKVEQDRAANPYPGPRTFFSSEADRFFGRNQEARELLAFVLSSRLVLFYAQSGAGKSSLINTRILPGLREEGFEVLPIGRVSGESRIESSQNLFLYNLMISLLQDESDPPDLSSLELSDFLIHLSPGADGRYRYQKPTRDDETPVDLQTLAEAATSLDRILIIDQFEEILTTNLQAWESRGGFFRQIGKAMEADPYLRILLVMREDHVAGLDPYAHLLPERLQTRYYMERMKREAAIQAVQRPAEAFGRPFEEDVAESLVDSLRLIRVSGYPQPQLGQFVEPVQLQVVCRQLWEELQTKQTDRIRSEDLPVGYVDQAMIRFYETALHRVSRQTETPERILRDWIDGQLITASGTRGIVYRNEEVGNTAGLENEIVDELVRNFILRTEARAGSTWYELVHDRLVEPIQDSNRAWQTAVRTRRTDALQFANQVQSVLDSVRTDRSDLALLLAREAVLTTLETDGYVEPGADAALQRAISGAPPWMLSLTPPAHSGPILTAFFHRDGTRLLSASLDGTARLWDVKSGSQIQLFAGHQDRVFCAVFDPEDQTVLTASADGTVLHWNIEDGQPIARFLGHGDEVFCARFSPDGSRIASCGADGSVRIWSVAQHREMALYERNERQINWLVYLPSGEELVAVSAQGEILWLDGETAALKRRVKSEEPTSYLWVTLDPTGERLALARQDGRAEIRDARTGELIHTLTGHGPQRELWVATFSPDGSRLLTAGHREVIEIFDLETASLEKQYQQKVQLTSADFHPDGSRFAVAGHEPQIFLYHVDAEWPEAHLGNSSSPLTAVAFLSDDAVLGLYSGIDLVRWDLPKQTELFRTRCASDVWGWTHLLESESRLLALTSDGRLDEIEVGSGELLSSVHLDELPADVIVRAAAFDKPGNRLAIAWEQRLVIYHRSSQAVLRRESFDQPVSALVFGSNEIELYFALADGAIRQLRQKGHDGFGAIAGEEDEITLALSRDGRRLAAARGQTLAIWDVEEGEITHSVNSGADAGPGVESPTIRTVVFHPREDEVAMGWQDGTVTLWTLADRTSRLSLLGHEGAVSALAYGEDGKQLLSGGADGTVRIWGTQPRREPRIIEVKESIQWSGVDEHGPLFCSRSGDLFRLNFDTGTKRPIDLPIRYLNNEACAWWADGGAEEELSVFHVSGALMRLRFSDEQTRQEVLRSFGSGGQVQVGSSLRLLATSDGYDLTVWNPEAGTIVMRKTASAGTFRSLAISPDDRLLAAATSEETIFIWEITSGREVHRLTGHTALINCIEFSPDSGWLASAAGSTSGERGGPGGPMASTPLVSRDTTVRLWQMSSGRERLRVGNHSRPVRSLRFSPDGRHLLTGGADGSVRIFDAGNGEEIRRLLRHSDEVNAAHYTLDGRFIVSSSEHQICLWRAELNDLLDLAASLVQRHPPILMEYEREQYRSPVTR